MREGTSSILMRSLVTKVLAILVEEKRKEWRGEA